MGYLYIVNDSEIGNIGNDKIVSKILARKESILYNENETHEKYQYDFICEKNDFGLREIIDKYRANGNIMINWNVDEPYKIIVGRTEFDLAERLDNFFSENRGWLVDSGGLKSFLDEDDQKFYYVPILFVGDSNELFDIKKD